MKFFCDGKATWPDLGLKTEKYNKSRRQQKASEKLHEIQLQNSLAKIILGFFLLLLSISFVAFLAGDTGLGNGLLVIILLKSPLIGGCLYFIIRNKIKKRKLDFHMSNNSLSVMYDWDYVKCRQCGGTDLAEIKSDVGGLEEQIRKREVVLRSPHHGNAALQCNGCGNWGHDRNKLDSDLQKNLDGEYMIGHCPKCNSTDHSVIVWGLPIDPSRRETDSGENIIYGGCCVPGNNPPYKSCNNCGHVW
jgi:hypothetical protein